MRNRDILPMQQFYDFDSCNYLTTFYAIAEIVSRLREADLFDRARAFTTALQWGDYSNNDISFPIVFRENRHYSGKRMRDILDNRSVSYFLISDRFKEALEQSGITGWKCYPIKIYDKKGNVVEGYNGFSVTGRAGKMQKYDTPPAELGYTPDSCGYYFDYHSWDGSDIFNTTGSNFLIVTERFIDMLKKYKITACQYTRLTDYGSSEIRPKIIR